MTESAAAALSPAEPAGEADNGVTTAPAANAPSWTEGLNFDDATMGYIQNKGWDSPAQMLDSYRNLEKFQGGSKSLVEIPGVDATEDQMSTFYDRLGRPGSPDQYGFEAPEGADTALMDWFGQTAHRYGLSSKQAQGMFNEWNEMSASRVENMQHEMKVQGEQAINDLKKEWGSDYDKMLSAGQLAVRNLGMATDDIESMEAKMGTAFTLKHFALLGSKMGEDSFVTGNESGGGFGTSPAQAAAQINDLRSDKQFMDAYMSGDQAAIQKMQRLMDIQYG